MNQKELIALNTLMSYARQGVRLLIQLFMVPFVISKVGDAEFGVYNQVLAIAGLVMLLDAGISPAVSRFMARELALKDDAACRQIWLTALTAYLVPMTLVLVALPLLAPVLAARFVEDAAYRPIAAQLMSLAAIYFALQFPAAAYKGALLGDQRHFAVANIEIIAEIVRASILVIYLTFVGKSIVAVLMVFAGTQIASNIVLAAMVHARFPWARFRRSDVSIARFRGVLELSITSFLAQVGFTLNLYMHRIVIGMILGPKAVTYYYVIASTFRDILETLVMQFATTTIPATAKYEATGDRGPLAALMLRGTKYAVIMAGLIAAPIAAFARPLLSIWMHRDPTYAEYAPLMMGILGLTLLELTRGTTHAMLIGLARMGLLGIVNLAAVVLDGTIAYLLMKHTSLGLYALLISVGSAVLLRRSVVVWNICSLLKLSKRRLVFRSMLWPLLPAAAAFGAGQAIQLVVVPWNWATLLITGTAAGLVGVFVATFITLNRDERSELLGSLGGIGRRIAARTRPPTATPS